MALSSSHITTKQDDKKDETTKNNNPFKIYSSNEIESGSLYVEGCTNLMIAIREGAPVGAYFEADYNSKRDSAFTKIEDIFKIEKEQMTPNPHLLTTINNKDKNLNSALMILVSRLKSDTKILEYLLKQTNLRLNDKDMLGDTPLILAVKIAKFPNIIEKLLLDNRTHPNEKNNKGNSALHIAVKQKYDFDIITLLLSPPLIDPNIQDYDGNTPLHQAISNNNFDAVIKLLNDKRTNIFIKNHSNKSCAKKLQSLINLDYSVSIKPKVLNLISIKLKEKQLQYKKVQSHLNKISSFRQKISPPEIWTKYNQFSNISQNI